MANLPDTGYRIKLDGINYPAAGYRIPDIHRMKNSQDEKLEYLSLYWLQSTIVKVRAQQSCYFLENHGSDVAFEAPLDDDWPLSNIVHNRLRVLHMFLCDNITVDWDILSNLYMYDCINEMHEKEIMQCASDNGRSSRLMFIVHRRSLKQYKQFLRTLRETEVHEFVVDVLEGNGGNFSDKV